MKKFLNIMGVLGASILTIVLAFLIFAYVLVLNIKSVVSENGMAKSFKKVDVVDTIKNADDGVMWEDFMGLADTLNLTEEQFEQILNSERVKEEVGRYIGEVVSSITNDKEASLTKEKVETILNVAIDEYNKVSDVKISDSERQEIVNSFDEEMIANMNEDLGNINLQETIDPQYAHYIAFVDNLLFGNYTLFMLLIILGIVGLIALCRFSYYKWIPYVQTSVIIAGVLMLIVGIILLVIPSQGIMDLFKNILTTKVSVTAVILFVIAIGLAVGKKYLKKYIQKKDEQKSDKKVISEEKIVENQKEDKKRKFDTKNIVIIAIILLLLLIIILLIFGRKGSYTITFDSNGGTEISEIEVKNGEIVKLPKNPEKEGYTFVGWTNEEGKILTEGTKLEDDVTLKAEWISADTNTITATFNLDENSGHEIILEKGQKVLLPVDPIREDYIFGGWVDQNGNLVAGNLVVNDNVIIKALWIKKGTDSATIKFDTDGGNSIGNLVIETGKTIILPITPSKDGYVFNGWVDGTGKPVTKDTIAEKNMTIKATWKEGYTCPKNCTPIEDGSKCTKTSTADLVTYTGCPTGTETIEKFCSDHQRQVSIGFDEDQTFIEAGILCDGNPTNFCVDYNSRYTISSDVCPSGYFKYTYSESGLDAVFGCAKKYDKGGSSCPSGYTQSGDICKKTETIKCTAN